MSGSEVSLKSSSKKWGDSTFKSSSVMHDFTIWQPVLLSSPEISILRPFLEVLLHFPLKYPLSVSSCSSSFQETLPDAHKEIIRRWPSLPTTRSLMFRKIQVQKQWELHYIRSFDTETCLASAHKKITKQVEFHWKSNPLVELNEQKNSYLLKLVLDDCTCYGTSYNLTCRTSSWRLLTICMSVAESKLVLRRILNIHFYFL